MKRHRKIIDMTEQLPVGLEYQDAHWEAALGMIEAHEAKMARYKVAGSILTAACVAGAILFWTVGFETAANTLAQADLKSNVSQDLGQINVDVRHVYRGLSDTVFGDDENVTATGGDSSVSLLSTGTQEAEAENAVSPINSHQMISEPSQANIIEGPHPNLAQNVAQGKSTTNSKQNHIEDYISAHLEDLIDSTSLSGEGITPSLEESNSSNPVPPEHLNITTTVSDDSSAQQEEVNPTAQPEVDVVSLWHGQWIGAIEEIGVSELPNFLDKTPVDISSKIPSHKLWTPRKRFNLQATVGSNVWMDYMSDDWDLYVQELDENFGNAASLRVNTDQEFERIGEIHSRFESSLLFGIEADYDLNKKWSVRAGLHYFSANNLRYVETTVAQLNLGGQLELTEEGEEIPAEVELPLYTTKLQYAALPVNLSYRIRNRFQLSLGLGLEYLIDGHNLRTDVAVVGFSGKGEIFETRGYVTGFEYWNGFASAGANYYLTESITIGANFQYGLNDMTRPDRFVLSTFDRPSRINGYLRFRIF